MIKTDPRKKDAERLLKLSARLQCCSLDNSIALTVFAILYTIRSHKTERSNRARLRIVCDKRSDRHGNILKGSFNSDEEVVKGNQFLIVIELC